MIQKLDERTDVDQKLMAYADKLVEWFGVMLAETPIEIDPAGTDRIVGPAHPNTQAATDKFPGLFGWDNVHFPTGFEQLFNLGLPGIADQARRNAESAGALEAHYLRSIAAVYDTAVAYVQRWADKASALADDADGDTRARLERIAENCRALTVGKPQTFQQVVQLAWFGLAMRNGALFSPLGRWDWHMGPFYAADLDAGRDTPESAQALIDELFTKVDSIGYGDGLMNLILGGVDREGNDVTNDVTFMMVDTSSRLKIACPQVNIRIHDNMSDAFRDKVTALQLAGTAKGTIFNDNVVIPALVELGMPIEVARNYSCDGCNEILIDGESLVDFWAVETTKALELALYNGNDMPRPEGAVYHANYHYADDNPPEVGSGLERGYASGDFTKMTTFEEFFEAFMDQFLYHTRKQLEGLADNIRSGWTEGVTPPFLAGTFKTALQTGNDPLRGGVKWRSIMLFSGSIPTVADALAAIKKVVFEDKACTPKDMLTALADDWEGHDVLRQQCLAAPKFGNDDDYVDLIAAEIVRRYSAFVSDFSAKAELGYPIAPALFFHTFNLESMAVGATPDGRKRGEPMAEHFSPVPGRAVSGPTAVINSMSKAPLHEMAGTAVTHVSLSRSALGTDAQASALMRTLVDTALKLGLVCTTFPIYSVDEMIDAQDHPERHPDLLVRVWGFSERFIKLDRRLQDHLIARAVGMGE
jgi:pyruvate-formate lyase